MRASKRRLNRRTSRRGGAARYRSAAAAPIQVKWPLGEATSPDEQEWLANAASKRLGLTRRESEVAACIIEEQSDMMIRETLGIAHSTVRRHIERMKIKLDVHTRVGIGMAVMREVVRMVENGEAGEVVAERKSSP